MYNRNTQPTDKEKALYIAYLQKEVLNAFNISFETFMTYNEDVRFLKALSKVTTTKRAICLAFEIRIDNACRYKKTLHEQGVLKQSEKKQFCKHSGHKAHYLSTNPNLIKV